MIWLGLSGRVWRALAGLLVVALVVGAIYIKGRLDGAESVSDSIAADNQEATDAANSAALSLSECVSAGRVWDFGAGKCAGSIFGGGD